ncbi:type II secretion system F family protein [Nitrosophilus kaiyonis]|uniref:type II secretion system F family protein n=1 Tax=Nitrosophilus kaiyonis TaxID=2930200 RepID=UPI002490C040|nr:type II secretion system F family protein [Nitrosophilus kaiyonis]
MFYIVEKIDTNGKKIKEVVKSSNIEEVLKKIENENAIPLNIFELPAFLSFFELLFSRKKIKKEDIIEILENLHLIIKSGMPIQAGLEDMAKESSNKDLKDMLIDISTSIKEGNSLSNSIRKYEKYFSPTIINLVKIGEATGELQSTLKKGADFLSRIENIKKKAKQAMIYPSFAFFAIFSAMLVWILYVLPKIIDAFKEMDVELPWITKAVISFSNFMQEYFFWILLFFIIAISGFIIFLKKNYKFRYKMSQLLLKTPVVSKFIIFFNIAFFSEYLRLSVVSGLPIFDALKTLQENIKNEVFKKHIENAIEKIAKGSRISDALKESNLYTPFTIRMIAMGEDSGALEEQLQHISDYYYEKVDYMAQNVAKFIEPIVIIVLGIFMAVIMLALFGPVYDLVSKVTT